MLTLNYPDHIKSTTSPTVNWPDNFSQLPARIRRVIGGDVNLHRQFDKFTRDNHVITFTLTHADNSLSWEVNGIVYFDPREEITPCEL